MSRDYFIQWNVLPAVRIYTPVADGFSGLEPRQSSAWTRYLEEHPDAWNGPLFRLVEADESGLTIAPGWYRDYVEACDSDDASNAVFVAVCGVLSVDDGYVLGRRAAGTKDPGTWEFAPAGGLQNLPLGKQLTIEIKEELSLDPQAFRILDPVGIYISPDRHIADIIIPVEVEVGASEVLEAFSPDEYDEVKVVGAQEIAKFVRELESPDGLMACVVQLVEDGAL